MVVILSFFGKFFYIWSRNSGVVLCLELSLVDSVLELVYDLVDLMMFMLLLIMVGNFYIEVGIEVVRFIEEVENEVFKVVFVFD